MKSLLGTVKKALKLAPCTKDVHDKIIQCFKDEHEGEDKTKKKNWKDDGIPDDVQELARRRCQ